MVNSYINLHNELLKLQLWDIEANSDVTHLESRNAEVNDLLKRKEVEVAQGKTYDPCIFSLGLLNPPQQRWR